MQQKILENFNKMDLLSQREEPFFFIIDFLLENSMIFTQEELLQSGLLIDFPHFKCFQHKVASDSKIEFQAYPETLEEYRTGFVKVQQNLQQGNSYLANYTRKTEIEINLSLEEIFYRSKAKYKVLLPGKFVFFSPETFIEICDNQIVTHPMKGTIDAAEENAEAKLKNDLKEKAEHHTVVDLLRNDLSIVADDVHVKKFQRVDTIQTQDKCLLAMSSEISGMLKEKYVGKVGSLLAQILPAGSILGAPKAKTLEIILDAERYDRGFYSGVCGWFDGKNLDSCVMIRFIENENGKLFFKSGGGITHRSVLEKEYQEMINKIYVPVY